MRELVISVTQAARRFADCINRVRYQNTSFVLHKNGVPVARIVPIEATSGSDFERLAVSLREARIEAEFDLEAVKKLIAGPDESPKTRQPQVLPKRPSLNW
jgi:prevent-host-death family protein